MAHQLLQLFFPLPPLASAEGAQVDYVLYLVHVLILVLFLGWGTFFIYALWRFRAKKNPRASYQGLSNKMSIGIEIAVAVAEVLLLFGLSIPYWGNYVARLPDDKNALHLQVVAQQFSWDIHYPGRDGKFGRTASRFYDDENNPLGLDPDDPNGKDDFVSINLMHLPVGVPAIIELTSKDVVHSFTLPEMRVKRDVIPGMRVKAFFTPTKTGIFDIACSQLCGIGHYRMKGTLIVQSPEAYKQWLQSHAVKYIANP